MNSDILIGERDHPNARAISPGQIRSWNHLPDMCSALAHVRFVPIADPMSARSIRVQTH